MVDLKPFHDSIERARRENMSDYSDPREAYRAALIADGFEPPKVIEIGRLQRMRSPDDKAKKLSGWSVYNEFDDRSNEGRAFGVATYGSFNGLPERVSWSSKSTHSMSQAERLEYNMQLEHARAMRDAEQKILHDNAAQEAFKIWQSARVATNDNPYLKRKGVTAADHLREHDDKLIIPITIDDQLTSLQYIKNEGDFSFADGGASDKKYLPGGRKKGCYFFIEGDQTTIYIAEGYATARSLNMITSNAAYVCFDKGNIYEVAAHAKKNHPDSRVVIAGDDDVFTTGNPGRTKAMQAAEGLGIEAVFPRFASLDGKPTDWNDLHAREGAASVLAQLAYKPPAYKPKTNADADTADILNMSPPGALGAIADYYNATAGNKQPLFAIQTAIAICSVLCARNFETNLSNRSSLFLINIAKSGTGKEHAKKIMEKVLDACNMGRLISGDGYTAGSAVISALQDRPRHITVIDEFSKYLQAAQNKYGSSHLMEANTQLMQAIGRLDGVMRPRAYATIGLAKDKKKELADMRVIAPAITLLAMSTPDDLFTTIDLRSIKDGFLNRFIICVSEAERALRQHKEPIDVPQNIIDWASHLELRRGPSNENSMDEPKLITLTFSSEAMELQKDFQQFCIDKANALEEMGMSEISGRSNEMAMRLALIAALAEDPMADAINAEHMAWAIAWVKYNLVVLIGKLKMSVSSSQHEGDKKEILKAIRESGEAGITWAMMQKRNPYSKHKKKDLKDILDTLVEAELIASEVFASGGRGRPTSLYKAIA